MSVQYPSMFLCNFENITPTEFADLVDTLTTQLNPTAARIKKISTVDTYMYHFHKSYFRFMMKSIKIGI